MQLIFISGSLRRSSLQVALLAGSRNTFAQTFVPFPNIDSSLTNENSETFNFGVKDGVRGFFTNPSRADDSFIPFKRVTLVEIQTWNLTGDGIYFRAKLYYNDNTAKVLFDGILKTNSTLTYNA